MKKLLLMRHSDAASDNPAWTDHERPLTARGRQLAQATARLLIDEQPDCILHSAAVRTTETAELVAGEFPNPPRLQSVDRLYLAPALVCLDTAATLAGQEDDVVMLIGHNPGIASLVNSWSGRNLMFFPASVAIFALNVNDWRLLQDQAELTPELTDFITDGVRQV